MGILDKLLGRKGSEAREHMTPRGQAESPSPAAPGPEFMYVGDDLYEVAYSPNRRFALGWADSSPGGHVGGYRGGGKGRWILLQDGRERSRGRLERPNDGMAADTGRFVLVDWLFGDRLAGAFYAFDPDGTAIVTEQLGANAGKTAISADGRYALVETLANPGSREWSNLLLAYDLDARSRLWATPLPSATKAIELEPAAGRIVLRFQSGRVHTAHLEDGSPGEAWIEPGADDPFMDLQELEEEVKAGLAVAGTEATLAWLERAKAVANRFGDYPNWRARALRLQGEALERLGRNADAIAAYSAGLADDANLGVRRRLKALGVDVPVAPKAAPANPAPPDDRPYASTTCPSCSVSLSPLPKAKAKCRSCGNPIWVRGGPDGMRHLLREDQLEVHEASWEAWREQQAREVELAAERQRQADAAAGLLAGLYEPEVVGESHYQAILRRHAGEIGERGAEQSVVVELVREPNNRYDRNAVAVRLAGETVGYIAADAAKLVGTMLKALERGGPCRARATIRGGSEWAPSFGISLVGIPDAYEFSGR